MTECDTHSLVDEFSEPFKLCAFEIFLHYLAQWSLPTPTLPTVRLPIVRASFDTSQRIPATTDDTVEVMITEPLQVLPYCLPP